MKRKRLTKREKLNNKERIKEKEKKKSKADQIMSARTIIHNTISQDQPNNPPRLIAIKLIKKRKFMKVVMKKIRSPKQMQMLLKLILIWLRKNLMAIRKSQDLNLKELKNGISYTVIGLMLSLKELFDQMI